MRVLAFLAAFSMSGSIFAADYLCQYADQRFTLAGPQAPLKDDLKVVVPVGKENLWVYFLKSHQSGYPDLMMVFTGEWRVQFTYPAPQIEWRIGAGDDYRSFYCYDRNVIKGD